MDFDVKEYIRESNLIENIDDPKEDEQSMIAWNYLKNQKSLSHSVIQKVQRTITINQTDLLPTQQGHYRSMSKVNVYVGDSTPPLWPMVDGMMDNWLLDLSESDYRLDPLKMHIRFEKIHPFADGNGRTGRMLLWWHEVKLGKKPTLFTDKEKHKLYYPLFNRGRERTIR